MTFMKTLRFTIAEKCVKSTCLKAMIKLEVFESSKPGRKGGRRRKKFTQKAPQLLARAINVAFLIIYLKSKRIKLSVVMVERNIRCLEFVFFGFSLAHTNYFDHS